VSPSRRWISLHALFPDHQRVGVGGQRGGVVADHLAGPQEHGGLRVYLVDRAEQGAAQRGPGPDRLGLGRQRLAERHQHRGHRPPRWPCSAPASPR